MKRKMKNTISNKEIIKLNPIALLSFILGNLVIISWYFNHYLLFHTYTKWGFSSIILYSKSANSPRYIRNTEGDIIVCGFDFL